MKLKTQYSKNNEFYTPKILVEAIVNFLEKQNVWGCKYKIQSSFPQKQNYEKEIFYGKKLFSPDLGKGNAHGGRSRRIQQYRHQPYIQYA